MSNFIQLKKALNQRFGSMPNLYKTEVSKEELWDTYLNSFPEGSNPIFRERTEHDCQCCKQFIRACGNVVSIIDGELVSIWDVVVDDPNYQIVVSAMSEVVKSRDIKDIFLHPEKNLGTDHNHEIRDGSPYRWDHFHFELSSQYVKKGADIASTLSQARSTKEVFKRGLEEITTESINTVLELIEQKSIYRGEENKGVVEEFGRHNTQYYALDNYSKDTYCWEHWNTTGARIRNTAIGTLLIDISEGMELDRAVKSFEAKVAPTNYKRPTALITKGMISNAEKKVDELGISESLQRRYAVTDDVTINNVIYADRSVKKAMNVFDELSRELPDSVKNLDKIDEVDIDTFINSILPKSDSVEIMFENKHMNNLMSLIAPVNSGSKNILKWDNNFSWSYNGEVTDSIKERVKKAGGNVSGDLRASLSWFNYDDLDLHAKLPNGEHIYFSNQSSRQTGCNLDVDMNAGGSKTRNAVENIVIPNKANLLNGKYLIQVHNYAKRETIDCGFEVEFDFMGDTHNFFYENTVKNGEYIDVIEFEYSHENGLKIINSLPESSASKEAWGISTKKFHKVNMVMNSPNHWDGKTTGNKHLFFILDGCKNDKAARGFFNEFLSESLTEHRKVFEVLGSKMKTAVSESQLSGLGFSSTQHNQIVCRVTGSFSRTIKINL